MNNFLQRLTPICLGLIIFSCASKPQLTSISPEIQEDINQVQKIAARRKEQGHHLLSPNHYKKAKEAIKEAQSTAEKGGDRQKINDSLAGAQSHLRKMDEAVQLGMVHMPEVMMAREAAKRKGATDLEKYKKAEDELAELGEELEEKNINDVIENKDKVHKMFIDTEITAMQGRFLAEARQNLRKAKKMDGVDSFKDLKEKTEKKITTAERLIEQSRKNPRAFREAVIDATKTSRRLLARASTATWIEDNSTRKVVETLENDFEKIAKPLTRIDTSMLDYQDKIKLVSNEASFMNVLQNELPEAKLADLRRQHSMQNWSTSKDIDKDFAMVSDKFDRDEVRLLRQGNNMIIRLTGLTFGFNDAKIPNDAKPLLDRLGNTLKDIDSERIRIEGHTDNVGSATYNRRLSEQRARAVERYLNNQAGISPQKTVAVGFGPNRPINNNKTSEDRKENRRIDITILGLDSEQVLAE